MRNTFKAYERLKREQHIDTLFRTGKAFSILPLRFIYHTVPRGAELSPVRVGFSVPKKKFRKAVQRNRVKRILREAWRLNKQSLYSAIPVDKHLQLFIICTANTIPEMDICTQAIIKGIEAFTKEFTIQVPTVQ